LWALEQALKSGHVGAVLTWLPQRLKADALRRLQLAAQAHDGPVFLFREVEARTKPSAAPLRLLLQGAGIDRLSVRVLKRRGPPLAQPLELLLPRVLSERLRLRAEAKALASVESLQQQQRVEASW
jgi:protein ImuA